MLTAQTARAEISQSVATGGLRGQHCSGVVGTPIQ
jgi:hypothetical protein